MDACSGRLTAGNTGAPWAALALQLQCPLGAALARRRDVEKEAPRTLSARPVWGVICGKAARAIPSNKLAEDVSPFPDIHMLISNARAWILGTFHGLGPKYMETYPAEFIYRFNRRHLEHRLFDRLVSACLWAPHMTVMDIVVV